MPGRARSVRRLVAGLFVVAGIAAAGSSCSFSEIDFEGTTCPCATGWTCIPCSNTCVRPTSSCAIQPGCFRVAWTTPSCIRWEWIPSGDPAQFQGYTLRIGEGSAPEDGGAVVEVTSDDNPELGHFTRAGTEGEDAVGNTITCGHRPGKLHWGQLVATDSAGCAFTSTVLHPTTAAETPDDHAIVIFDEELPAGSWTEPDGLAVADDAGLAHSGTHYLAWDVTVTDGQNVQLGDLHLPLAAIGADVAKTAFLEFEIALTAGKHCFYSWAMLRTSEPAASMGRYGTLEPFAVKADDAYQVVQIPLRGLAASPPLSSSDTLRKFQFGCKFSESTLVRIDDVRIRW